MQYLMKKKELFIMPIRWLDRNNRTDFGGNPLQARGVLNVEFIIDKVVSVDASVSIITTDAPAW